MRDTITRGTVLGIVLGTMMSLGLAHIGSQVTPVAQAGPQATGARDGADIVFGDLGAESAHSMRPLRPGSQRSGTRRAQS